MKGFVYPNVLFTDHCF